MHCHIKSYDSSVHDVFDEDECEERENIIKDFYDEFINLKGIKESYLVIDFRKNLKPIVNEGEKKSAQEGKSKLGSIEVKKGDKNEKKAESFMEYYNSISKKGPSNIL